MPKNQEHWLAAEEAMTFNAENEYQIIPWIFCSRYRVLLNQQL